MGRTLRMAGWPFDGIPVRSSIGVKRSSARRTRCLERSRRFSLARRSRASCPAVPRSWRQPVPTIRVTLAGQELDKAGLLLDFKDLKEALKPVVDRLDHQMINDLDPFKVLNPSAENLAKYFFDETNVNLDRVTRGRVRVKNVTVYETDTTMATYSE